MDFLTQKLGIVPYWQIAIVAAVAIVLLFLKRTREAVVLVLVFWYIHFFRTYWPDTTVVSGAVTARVGMVIGVGLVIGFVAIYLFIIKGE